MLKGVESVINDFPELGTRLERITTSSDGVMCCDGEAISFNPAYFSNKGDLDVICEQQALSGLWIKNASASSVGVHEAAHAVEWLLIEKNPNYLYPFQKAIAWNGCDEAKIIVNQAVKSVKKTEYGKGKKKYELTDAISKYASQTESEAMAEAFADVYANGANANPLSIEIKETTKKQYLKYSI